MVDSSLLLVFVIILRSSQIIISFNYAMKHNIISEDFSDSHEN